VHNQLLNRGDAHSLLEFKGSDDRACFGEQSGWMMRLYEYPVFHFLPTGKLIKAATW
jgi:hypothetical protein